jgi:hypothetical protein
MEHRAPLRPAYTGFIFRLFGALAVLATIYLAAQIGEDTPGAVRFYLYAVIGGGFSSGALMWSFGEWLRNVDERLRVMQEAALRRDSNGAPTRGAGPGTGA